MNAVIIDHHPFAMNSNILVSVEGKEFVYTAPSRFNDLAKVAVDLAYQFNCFTILTGMTNAAAEEFKNIVVTIEQSAYSTNKIIVEGI